MARTTATLPEGSRITDYISLGVIAKTFPIDKIRAVLSAAPTRARVGVCPRLDGRSGAAPGQIGLAISFGSHGMGKPFFLRRFEPRCHVASETAAASA
jgi:hypothetical protein